MDALYALLREIGTEAEKNAKRDLSGSPQSLKALLYNMAMPVILNFRTEEESYHFIFQKGGSVSLHCGVHAHPDVNVSAERLELIRILQNRDKEGFTRAERTGRLKISEQSFKGKLAVMKLRELFL